MMRNTKKTAAILSIIILALFFMIGLHIYRDYGASNDELNQIEAGHVIWKFLCRRFGLSVPEAISDAPELHEYFNRYYGQAVTFPTVVFEAVRGFALDSSTILAIRHLWNFLNYFAGLCCFAILLYQTFDNPWCTPIGLLFMILLPRIFGDIFYNDRDTMLTAWLMISLAALYRYMKTSRWHSGIICAFAFAVTINTRLFGLVLAVFTLLFLFDPAKRKNVLFLLILSAVFWILLSPVYWDNPIKSIPESFYYLSVKQRSVDTNGGWPVLFLGKYINEKQLPWYYVPLYILITTPLVTTLMSLFGMYIFSRKLFFTKWNEWNFRKYYGTGMLILLIPFLFLVILFRPSLYNGWRHFYFLYLPIIWMAVEGSSFFLDLPKKTPARFLSFLLTGLSFVVSAVWMISVHPNQGIYMTPVVRKQLLGKFERDYWNISVPDCARYLLSNSAAHAIHVTGNNWFQNVIPSLPPADRERFHPYPLRTQPYPFEYLYYNYFNDKEENVTFDYYAPVFSVIKDGIKLSEVFQRSHTNELNTGDTIEKIYSYDQGTEIDVLADNDYDSYWLEPGNPADLVIQFSDVYTLLSIELFPFDHRGGIPDLRLFVSDNGNDWNPVEFDRSGTNGLRFSPTETRYLRLQCDTADFGIRDFLFYGY